MNADNSHLFFSNFQDVKWIMKILITIYKNPKFYLTSQVFMVHVLAGEFLWVQVFLALQSLLHDIQNFYTEKLGLENTNQTNKASWSENNSVTVADFCFLIKLFYLKYLKLNTTYKTHFRNNEEWWMQSLKSADG